MNALRTRTPALFYVSQRSSTLPKTVSGRARPFASAGPVTPHTPDTYQKDDEVNPPASSKIHVVSEIQHEDPRAHRPFESPSGAYSNVNFSKPYDAPAHDDSSKLGYGGTERGGGGPKDVHGGGGPQDAQGKTGRQ